VEAQPVRKQRTKLEKSRRRKRNYLSCEESKKKRKL
jgi:hypothetical protein